jgi:hypothetical protein
MAGKKKQKSSSLNFARNLQRKLAMAQGFYDGRFKEKRIKDKKKEENRRKARGKIRLDEKDL